MRNGAVVAELRKYESSKGATQTNKHETHQTFQSTEILKWLLCNAVLQSGDEIGFYHSQPIGTVGCGRTTQI